MKKCSFCKIEKRDDDFYKCSCNKCKECVKESVRKRREAIGDVYDRTRHGVLRVMYKTQKRNNILRGYGDMEYSKSELGEWLSNNGFDDMYSDWVSSGFIKDLKPSVDRIDSEAGYSIGNIRLVTWRENRMSQYDDIKKGSGSSGKRCKPLLKISHNGCILKEYPSYNEAKRDAGYSLEYQIKNKTKCRNGFLWRYK